MQRNRLISDDIMSTIPSKEGMSAAEWLAEQMPGGFFIYRALKVILGEILGSS